MKKKLLRGPPSWGWFIGILVMSVREIMRGHYLGLLTGIPFLLVSILAVKQLQLPLWIIFTVGAAVNLLIVVTGHLDYISAGIYLLLIVYGIDESYKITKRTTKSINKQNQKKADN
jgi:hypothetical protein